MSTDNSKATSPASTGYSGELAERMSKAREFVHAGWVLSHALNATAGLCDDGSCYRCRLTSLLVETETMFRLPFVSGISELARVSRESESGVDIDHLRPHQHPRNTKDRREYCQHCHGKGWLRGLEVPCKWCNPAGESRGAMIATPHHLKDEEEKITPVSACHTYHE